MNTPSQLLYTTTHEWVERQSSDTVRIGLTDYAQNAMGDLVFVNLPEVGEAVTAGQTLGDVESVKAVSDILCPVSGEISAVNEELLDAPQLINTTPYDAWLVEITAVRHEEELLDAEAYVALCQEEG